jgi:translation initiation factor RLI1
MVIAFLGHDNRTSGQHVIQHYFIKEFGSYLKTTTTTGYNVIIKTQFYLSYLQFINRHVKNFLKKFFWLYQHHLSSLIIIIFIFNIYVQINSLTHKNNK